MKPYQEPHRSPKVHSSSAHPPNAWTWLPPRELTLRSSPWSCISDKPERRAREETESRLIVPWHRACFDCSSSRRLILARRSRIQGYRRLVSRNIRTCQSLLLRERERGTHCTGRTQLSCSIPGPIQASTLSRLSCLVLLLESLRISPLRSRETLFPEGGAMAGLEVSGTGLLALLDSDANLNQGMILPRTMTITLLNRKHSQYQTAFLHRTLLAESVHVPNKR